MFYLMLEYSITYRICKCMQKKKKKSQHIKPVSIYAIEINWFVIHDTELIHATHISLFIKIFFYF